MSWRTSAAIMRHEVRIMIKDPSTMLFVLFMPLAMTALMKPLYQSAMSQQGVANATGLTLESAALLVLTHMASWCGERSGCSTLDEGWAPAAEVTDLRELRV